MSRRLENRLFLPVSLFGIRFAPRTPGDHSHGRGKEKKTPAAGPCARVGKPTRRKGATIDTLRSTEYSYVQEYGQNPYDYCEVWSIIDGHSTKCTKYQSTSPSVPYSGTEVRSTNLTFPILYFNSVQSRPGIGLQRFPGQARAGISKPLACLIIMPLYQCRSNL